MTRQTSINCYNEIRDNGLLSKRRLEVYDILYHNGPITAGELFQLGLRGGVWNNAVKGGICARLTELRDAKVAAEVGLKVCSSSNKEVILWDVTSNLPTTPKKNTKPKNLKKCIEYILKGMERRGWNEISVDTLKKLKENA